jgi:hypothetical protein
MVNEEENTQGQQSEKQEAEMFACPSCQAEVAADATMCSDCGVSFEQEEGIPPPEEEAQLPTPPTNEQEQVAPPQEIANQQVAQPEQPQPAPQATPPPSYGVGNTDMRVASALKEYSKKRRGRYLSGALFLGLGIILFVLLWVFVVHQVLVTETENLFGFEIIMLIVGAGIFFILGLYMILTYPKSSLVDVFASVTQTQYMTKGPRK